MHPSKLTCTKVNWKAPNKIEMHLSKLKWKLYKMLVTTSVGTHKFIKDTWWLRLKLKVNTYIRFIKHPCKRLQMYDTHNSWFGQEKIVLFFMKHPCKDIKINPSGYEEFSSKMQYTNFRFWGQHDFHDF